MAGRIKADDIALVKERSSIEDVVREHVTLRPAGAGLDEGAVPVPRREDPVLQHPPRRRGLALLRLRRGRRRHLLRAEGRAPHLHRGGRAARRRSSAWSCATRRAAGPRDGGVPRPALPARRGPPGGPGVLRRTPCSTCPRPAPAATSCAPAASTAAAAERFGVGFAPRGGEALARHLRAKGFTDDELVTGGLVRAGQSRALRPVPRPPGLADPRHHRRHGRLRRPAPLRRRPHRGEVPQHLRDPDLQEVDRPLRPRPRQEGRSPASARRSSSRATPTSWPATSPASRRAVATCGTAFGVDHIKMLRRIMRDEADLAPARVIFTFDGDAAGQKAAMRAFGEDQRWASQSFVAVGRAGMDPCELRLAKGDAAVRALVEDAVPMFEFAVRTTINRFDLDTAEGRVQAHARRRADRRRRSATSRCARSTPATVAGLARRRGRAGRSRGAPAPADGRRATAKGERRGRRRPPRRRRDRAGAALEEAAATRCRARPARPRRLRRAAAAPGAAAVPRRLRGRRGRRHRRPTRSRPRRTGRSSTASLAAGGIQHSGSTAAWADKVAEAAPLAVRGLVSELAVAPLPTRFDKATGLPSAATSTPCSSASTRSP